MVCIVIRIFERICMGNRKKQEIIILLRDFMNILPPGPQEAFVPLGGGSSNESGWLITPELELRMNKNTLVGETYDVLQGALRKLDKEEPEWYGAIVQLYLQDGSGHRDVDDIRIKAGSKGEAHPLANLLYCHDNAISWLAEELENEDLYVRWPQKAPGPQPGQNMDERHTALFAVFLRYIEDGIPYRQSVRNAAFKCEYSPRHAERIIKPRWKEYNEA
jgi:hypothetical protein